MTSAVFIEGNRGEKGSIMSPQALENSDLYESKNPIGKVLRDMRVQCVFKHIKGELLDLACGDNLLVKMHGKGVGVDVESYAKDVTIVETMNQLPFEDEKFDTITIIASLNYFDSPLEALKEVRRVLKPNGRVLVTMPNYTLIKIWHLFRERHANKPGFKNGELKDLFQQSNLSLSETEHFMFWVNKLYILEKSPSKEAH